MFPIRKRYNKIFSDSLRAAGRLKEPASSDEEEREEDHLEVDASEDDYSQTSLSIDDYKSEDPPRPTESIETSRRPFTPHNSGMDISHTHPSQNYDVDDYYSGFRQIGSGIVENTNASRVVSPPIQLFPTIPFQPLSVKMENCLNSGYLDMQRVGGLLFHAYANDEEDVDTEIELFIKNNSTKVKGPLTIKRADVRNPNWPAVIACGHQLMEQINSHKIQISLSGMGPSKEEFCDITGAAFNVRKEYFYPQEPPFSGERICVSELKTTKQQPHVHLKSILFALVSKSCAVQTHVQAVTWVLPQEKNTSGRNPKPFPESFFNTLYELCLEYFGLNYDELDVPYRSAFRDLPCLEPYSDESGKRRLFQKLATARKSFVTGTFRTQLKAALVELKYSTFVAPQLPQQHGYFQYRKRGRTSSTPRSMAPNHHIEDIPNEPDQSECVATTVPRMKPQPSPIVSIEEEVPLVTKKNRNGQVRDEKSTKMELETSPVVSIDEEVPLVTKKSRNGQVRDEKSTKMEFETSPVVPIEEKVPLVTKTSKNGQVRDEKITKMEPRKNVAKRAQRRNPKKN
ncbi:unnamed protein product [Caenorhabditis sp. 36 PRJEB53466]|nr:unnamed protein product [Caenorhabditis sp. 36 PRJEB53466]